MTSSSQHAQPITATAMVVGASRGLGHGIATALAAAGTPVVAVARSAAALDELARADAIQTEVADASDPSVAGAKSTQRFITSYARDEAEWAGLGIAFTVVLPPITPLTGLGQPAVAAYAARSGQTEEEYLKRFGPALSPAMAGAAIVELVRAEPSDLAPEYLLSAAGLEPLL